ncbi:hypothetical protein L4G92_03545 [Neisseria sp. ZJ106]|uniref:Beta-ketoacyl synthase N-terminal domain-containing protein n=1 Tax=Neisseria lisongii TaxID=2912188 RepID=A0ABY7RMQ7_9NEIS|nr:hypothetical protein [Neisseria lisongii]MCF7521127.1 hypothetical protein [Neisseria lisongii]WCL72051.1 hypothetical protein PJU73_02750 [Neisseria lisongii]
MNTLYLHAYHHFFPDQAGNNQNLRHQLKQYGIDSRRQARFTQLALLGALPLQHRINSQTAVYLSSPYSSPEKFDRAFAAVHQHQTPSPLDFMANTHNAAVFHLAQLWNIQAETLFLSIDTHQHWQPVWLAQNYLAHNPDGQILLGWAFEAGSIGGREGSCWWLLGSKADGALAEIGFTPSADNLAATDFLAPFTQFEQDIVWKKKVMFVAEGLAALSVCK